ncbi:hypothetical protein AB0H00_04220 [Nocardia sp. NPDC023852]|uniref:hypothetical protein n=2 Tax=unclassified Nocardia TaxID=2637762 RepID=UPI0033CC60B8
MDIAALVTWVLTASGGAFLLGTWIAKGGLRRKDASHFPPALIFGHFALAAIGLIIWIVYLPTDNRTLAWIAFALLVPVALLGFLMLARWLPTYQNRTTNDIVGSERPEQHFPVAVVVGHGLLAVITVLLVLLASAGVGSS